MPVIFEAKFEILHDFFKHFLEYRVDFWMNCFLIKLTNSSDHVNKLQSLLKSIEINHNVKFRKATKYRLLWKLGVQLIFLLIPVSMLMVMLKPNILSIMIFRIF